MNTLDRIRTVAEYYGLTPSLSAGNLHQVLDVLDTRATIRTRCRNACPGSGRGACCNHAACKQQLTVGQRLAHHEEKITNPNYFFWLGEEG